MSDYELAKSNLRKAIEHLGKNLAETGPLYQEACAAAVILLDHPDGKQETKADTIPALSIEDAFELMKAQTRVVIDGTYDGKVIGVSAKDNVVIEIEDGDNAHIVTMSLEEVSKRCTYVLQWKGGE
jgi:hypothetical protein